MFSYVVVNLLSGIIRYSKIICAFPIPDQDQLFLQETQAAFSSKWYLNPKSGSQQYLLLLDCSLFFKASLVSSDRKYVFFKTKYIMISYFQFKFRIVRFLYNLIDLTSVSIFPISLSTNVSILLLPSHKSSSLNITYQHQQQQYILKMVKCILQFFCPQGIFHYECLLKLPCFKFT